MRDFPVLWQTASAIFFIYVGAIAVLRRRAPGRSFALRASGVGLLTTVTSILIPRLEWMHEWVLPPTLLLLAYWSSGALFTAPMQRAETLLIAMDRKLGIPRAATPRAIAEILETAYVGVYPIVAVGFVLHLSLSAAPNADRFWAVVLITDFICFGMLPWVQTRPPRTLETREPWQSSVRRFNLRLVGAASIRVNTFPSGHTAEAVAVALLSIGAPIPVVLAMFVSAAAISAGAVLGRYHYAVDAIAGWLVGVIVWLAVAQG
jgi:membrane-associated phospholipid phosphatase